MKKHELKALIREIFTDTFNENQPAPSRPKPEVHPGVDPGTKPGKVKPRRGFEPGPKTKPKAENRIRENEKAITDKIAKRFSNLKKNG
jgi:hypothetical protein